MGVQHDLHVGPSAEDLGVDVDFVGHRVPVVDVEQIPGAVCRANVIGDREEESLFLGPATADEQAVSVSAADVAEDVLAQATESCDATTGGDPVLKVLTQSSAGHRALSVLKCKSARRALE